MSILVPVMAGFIGRHGAAAMTACGKDVIGIADPDDHHAPKLKRDRLAAPDVAAGGPAAA